MKLRIYLSIILLAASLICIFFWFSNPGFSQQRSERLLIFGIDAVGWNALDPMLESGQLPTLAGILKRGISARLITLNPTVSVMLWTTMITGLQPEKHGISSWLSDSVDGAGQLAITSDYRKTHALWNLNYQHKYLFVNWWASWPAESINGIMVSNRAHFAGVNRAISPNSKQHYLTNTARITRSELEAELSAINPEKTPIKVSDFLFNKLQTDRFYLDTTLSILTDHNPTIVGTFVRGIDILEHEYLNDIIAFDNAKPLPEGTKGIVRAYYIYLDRFLDRILKQMGPNTAVCIVSDHGMEPIAERPPFIEGLRFDDLLAFTGFISKNPDGSLDLANANFRDSKNRTVGLSRIARLNLLQQNGSTQKEQIDSFIKTLGELRIDDRPLFTQIQPIEYDSDQISCSLDSQSGPESIITFSEKSIKLKDLVSMIIHPSAGQHWNAPDGICILSGNEIRPSSERQSIRIVDIMPTLARLMDLPIAQNLDGQPQDVFFKPDFLKLNLMLSIPTYGDFSPARSESTNEVIDRDIRQELKSLGYIQQ